MRFDEFDMKLSAFLKGLPAGTVADLTDDMIAWWDGRSTVYASFDSRKSTPTREINLSENWEHFRDWLCAWMEHPQFSGALLAR
jgi:hypothetical protein